MKQQWQKKFNSTPPKSPATMRMVLDWYGETGLSRTNPNGTSPQDEVRINRIIAKLEELVDTQEDTKKIPTNTKLIKTWRGKRYEVSVVNEGYLYEGERYKSLSKIAKVITGTHQSGNIFFGLTKKARDKKEGKSNE